MGAAVDRGHEGNGAASRRSTRRVSPLAHATAAFLAAGAMPAGAGAQQSAAPLVFDGVTVVDVTQGTLVPDQRVVIAGNRIQTVGAAQAVPMPKGARVVDAKGKYLLPGFWDMHVHPMDEAPLAYPLMIANGITGIRDAGTMVPLDTLTRWRREILAGTRVGPPRQLLSGPAVDEKAPCRRNSDEHICIAKGDTADARHVVDSLKAAGADIIKTYDLSDDMYFALARAARHAGLPVGGHTMVPATAASDSGALFIDHTTLNRELSDACLYGEDASVEQCRPIAELFARNGTWWVPTWINQPLAGRERTAWIYTDFNDFLLKFWADSAAGTSLHEYLHRGLAVAAGTEEPDPSLFVFRNPRPSGGTTPDTAGYLYVARNAGLPIVAGTDAVGVGTPMPVSPTTGFTFHAELATYVAEGLTPLETLQSATLNPAKALHATDSLGTVAAGKLADLVLLDGNPLADITNTAAIRAVVANGRYYDRAALDGLLAEVQAKGKKTP